MFLLLLFSTYKKFLASKRKILMSLPVWTKLNHKIFMLVHISIKQRGLFKIFFSNDIFYYNFEKHNMQILELCEKGFFSLGHLEVIFEQFHPVSVSRDQWATGPVNGHNKGS